MDDKFKVVYFILLLLTVVLSIVSIIAHGFDWVNGILLILFVKWTVDLLVRKSD